MNHFLMEFYGQKGNKIRMAMTCREKVKPGEVQPKHDENVDNSHSMHSPALSFVRKTWKNM